MEFQNAIITNEGVRIFQRAGANDNVVFTSVLFCGADTTLSKETEVLPSPTWGNGVVNNYAARADAGGDFVLYMSLTNDTDHGYAYGYGVYGYLQSEGVENEKLLIVANHAGTVTYVSEASGSYTRFHLAITMRLHLSSNVISIAPHYNDLVSDVAFQDLADRVVTTHAPANESVGEDQSIYGYKSFRDGVEIGNQGGHSIQIESVDTGTLYDGRERIRLRTDCGTRYGAALEFVSRENDEDSYTQNNIVTNANLIPMGSGLNLGGISNKWFWMYSEHARIDQAEFVGYTVFAGTSEVAMNGTTVAKDLTISESLKFANNAAIEGEMNVTGDVQISGTLNASSMRATSLITDNLLVNMTVVTRTLNATVVQTNGLKLSSGLDNTNYPIPNMANVPVGTILLVKFFRSDPTVLYPGDKLTGCTLESLSLFADTDEVTFANVHIQAGNFPLPDSDGAHYVTLTRVDNYGDWKIALAMKVSS